MQKNSYILGHRGARGEMPENTLAGFEYTHALQKLNTPNTQYLMAGIEFDVQLTADDQLIITHDDNLKHLGNKQVLVDQVNAAYIKQSYVYSATKHNVETKNGSQQILTLPDMPKVLTEYAHIELEIKTHERTNHKKLINSLEAALANPKFHALNITLTSFDNNLLFMLKYHLTLSKLPRGLLIEKPLNSQSLVDMALAIGAKQVGIKQQYINKKMVKACKRHKLETTAWTVNDFKRAETLIKMGVDVIITDYPKALHHYLNN